MTNYLKLEDICDDEAKAIFQFRSHMANFHANYKNNKPINHSPLCLSHPDTQQWSFKCSVLRKNITIKGNYENILKWRNRQKFGENSKVNSKIS